MAVAPAIDLERESVMRAAASALGAEVRDVEWQIAPLAYSVLNPVSAGVYKITGTATLSDGRRPWSCVLKICREPPPEDVARLPAEDRRRFVDTMRWDREAEAYGSDLLAELPDGVGAPRCFAIERRTSAARLWLELVDDGMPSWDVARYALAARHLGRLNGTYLTARALPTFEWLSRDFIRKWSAHFARATAVMIEDDRLWTAPVIAAAFDPAARDDLRRMLSMYEGWLGELDRLPQTLAHFDAFRANMLSRERPHGTETVLIDWAFIGRAALAADLAQLVVGSVFYHGDPLDVHQLDTAAFDGYAAGLRDAGYLVSDVELRRAYVVNALARWAFVLGPLAVARDRARQERDATILRRPYAKSIALLADRTRYLTALADDLD